MANLGDLGGYAGYHLIEDPRLVVIDWSGCRSPARARRRLRRGFSQRVTYKPDTTAYFDGRNVSMHPETARRFKQLLRAPERTAGIIETMRREREQGVPRL